MIGVRLPAVLFAISLSFAAVLHAQAPEYTVTDLGALDDGGRVTGNHDAMRRFEVAGVTTSRIRVVVDNTKGNQSRIVEVEAWDGWEPASNVALASRGAKATASSRWLQIDFGERKTLTRVFVHTVQDVAAFEVQYWTGSAWAALPNIAESRAFRINDAGVVVGDSGSAAGPNNKLPFRWENGVMTALGAEGSASSINAAGVIVGASRNPTTGQQDPYRWFAGTLENLGALGKTGTWAHDINDADPAQIVGTTETDAKALATRAWIWSAAPGKVLIPTLPDGTSNSANAINNLGHVVGASNTAGSEQHAFLSIGETVTDLGTLGGPWSTAQDINDAGAVVGASRIDATTRSQPIHAFRWTTDRGMLDLGTLGGPQSWAFGINNAGVIVGSATTSAGTESAFVYDAVRGLRNLNALTAGSGWTLSVARSINNRGQIVGWGVNPAGIQRAFLLTPISGSRRTPRPSAVP